MIVRCFDLKSKFKSLTIMDKEHGRRVSFIRTETLLNKLPSSILSARALSTPSRLRKLT